MKRSGLRVVVVAALLVAGAAAPARAQDVAEQAAAEALFREARDLLEQGNIADACAKFAESQRLDPKLGTLLNLASCHEKEGKTATAWAEFSQAVGMAVTAGQQARAEYARSHAEELEAKLSRVLFRAAPGVADAEGLAIHLGDKELGAATIGSKIPLDPGRYPVEVTATGKQAWSTEIEVPPGPSTIEVAIPVLPDRQAALPPPAEPPPPAAPAEPLLDGPTRRTLGLVLGGVGLVGVGLGAYFGIRTFAQKGVTEDNCVGRFCNAEGLDASRGAHTSATLSTVAFIAGGALLAGGAVLVLTAGDAPAAGGSAPRSEARIRQVWLSPDVGTGGAALRLGGAW